MLHLCDYRFLRPYPVYGINSRQLFRSVDQPGFSLEDLWQPWTSIYTKGSGLAPIIVIPYKWKIYWELSTFLPDCRCWLLVLIRRKPAPPLRAWEIYEAETRENTWLCIEKVNILFTNSRAPAFELFISNFLWNNSTVCLFPWRCYCVRQTYLHSAIQAFLQIQLILVRIPIQR